MHSDDYSDAMKGLSWSSISEKYLRWSGRLVADILSPALASLSHPAKSLLTALAVTVLVYAVSTIMPVKSREKTKFQPAVFLIIFLSYWLFNPALGQNTFWVVGSANYLWPLLFCVLYLKYAFHFIELQDKRSFVLACVFAFFAGCSNEAGAGGVTCIIGLLLLMNIKNREVRGKLFALFALCMIGVAVLLLAPGNASRLAIEGKAWQAVPLPEKLTHYLPLRLMQMLKTFFQILIPITLLALYLKLKSHIGRHARGGPLFLFAALMASLALCIAAPKIYGRMNSSASVLLLCSLSCLLWEFFLLPPAKIKQRFTYCIIAILTGIFTVQYALMIFSYYNLTLQDRVRVEIIRDGISKKDNTVHVPDFYYTSLLSKKHKLDTWTGYQTTMARYYGIDTIDFDKNIQFNYAILENATDFLKINAENEISAETVELLLFTEEKGLIGNARFVIGIPGALANRTDTLKIEMLFADGKQKTWLFTNGIEYKEYVYFGSDKLKTPGPVKSFDIALGSKLFTRIAPVQR